MKYLFVIIEIFPGVIYMYVTYQETGLSVKFQIVMSHFGRAPRYKNGVHVRKGSNVPCVLISPFFIFSNCVHSRECGGN